jgi:Ca2+-binding EF-hand superfamily protein
MSRVGSSSKSSASSLSVQQLRDKLGKLLVAAGQHTAQQQTEYLSQYFSKWSMNRQRMNNQQFIGALQSLQLPLSGAGDVFAALDVDGSGSVDIREFCDAMTSDTAVPFVAKPRLATRSAGSEIVGSGRPPVVERGYTPRQAPMSHKADSSRMGFANGNDGPSTLGEIAGGDRTSFGERGFTPRQVSSQPTSVQKAISGSRKGSRMNSASSSRMGSRAGSTNRSPVVPGTPQSANMKTVKIDSMTSTAGLSRSQTPIEVELADLFVAKFREILVNHGGSAGIHSLGRIFRMMDDDGNRQISLEELQYGLQHYGLAMAAKDLQLLLAAIDKDNTGRVSFDEFLLAIRGVVNARRQALINTAFDVLDASGDGQIQVNDIAANFKAQGHPDVMAGKLSEDVALSEFLSQFDGVDQNGIVTRAEFLDYYRNVSASIDDDDYFELMIRNAWHLAGGSGQYENTASTRLLVIFVDGTQKVVALQHDRGLDVRNPRAVKAQLKAQGITNIKSFSTGIG